MHEALRYLPYLLIKIADSIKNAGTTIHIVVPAVKKQKKETK